MGGSTYNRGTEIINADEVVHDEREPDDYNGSDGGGEDQGSSSSDDGYETDK